MWTTFVCLFVCCCCFLNHFQSSKILFQAIIKFDTNVMLQRFFSSVVDGSYLSLSLSHTHSLSHTRTHIHLRTHTHIHTHTLKFTHTHNHTLPLSLYTHTFGLRERERVRKWRIEWNVVCSLWLNFAQSKKVDFLDRKKTLFFWKKLK